MRLTTCTAAPRIDGLPSPAETSHASAESTFELCGSGRSERRQKTGLLAAIQRRFQNAVLAGLATSLLVGATGCATRVVGQHVPTPPRIGVQLPAPTPQSPTPTPPPVTKAKPDYEHLSVKSSEILNKALDLTKPFTQHAWRDTPVFNKDGTVNGFIEIPMGKLEKNEFDIETNKLKLDRTLPADLIGYPINYGYFPQTHSYDGDPYDILVLGPPLPLGSKVRGKIVAVMYFEDEKGLDMKTVVSPVDDRGRPLYRLTDDDKKRIGEWFSKYKDWEKHKGKFSRVLGWGGANEGKRFIERTHRFFEDAIKLKLDVKAMRDMSSVAIRPIRILVTGFEPWIDGTTQNMSGEIAKALAHTATSMSAVSLETLILPVQFEEAARLAGEKIDQFKPDLVIGLGESPGLKKIEFETYGQNVDNDGKIDDQGPLNIHTRFNMQELGRRTDAGTDALEILVNGSPGSYVCNDLFYRLLAKYGQSGPSIVFAHVPAISDLPVSTVLDGIGAMLKSAVEIIREEAPLRDHLIIS